MSSCHTELIPCSHCGRKGDFVLWDFISTELADKVKDESLFQWTCPHCGYGEHIWHLCLYHDMKRQFMVYFCDDPKLDVPRDLKGRGYILRRTAMPEDFIEKILILEQGIDDRAVAMMKPFIEADLEGKGAPLATKIYFRGVDRNRFLFECFSKGQCGGYMGYDMGRFYNYCVTQCLGEPVRDVFQTIDRDWAERQLKKSPCQCRD